MSEKYRYAITEEEKAAIESAAKDVVMRPSRINNPNQVICIDIAETLSAILAELFGIYARVVPDGSGPHVYVEARTENYGKIRLDYTTNGNRKN